MADPTERQYDPGAELLPDWSDVPVNDEREPEGDPHDAEED